MGLNEDLGDRENIGNASLRAQRIKEAKMIDLKTEPKCFGTGNDYVIGCNCKGVFECLVLTQ